MLHIPHTTVHALEEALVLLNAIYKYTYVFGLQPLTH